MNAFLATCAAGVAVLLLGCASDPHGSRSLPPGGEKAVLAFGGKPLTAAESAILNGKGFVITRGAEVQSFHLGYTALFKAHAPVYFTADALLHALHCSYDDILKAVEETTLVPDLGTMISELRAGLRADQTGSAEARADLDLYLGVADSLLRGKPSAPVAGAPADAIAGLFARADAAQGSAEVPLFGEPVDLDLSMLEPRGHYTESEELSRYFKASMWLGRTEIRIAHKERGAWRVNRRALAATLLLHGLYETGEVSLVYRRIERTTAAFIGPPDAMSFYGLARAAHAAGLGRVRDLAGLGDDDVGRALEREAAQRIGSQRLYRGDAPIAFLLLGQRYVFDSEVFSAVTYGRLAQKRMMPSPLDVGFAALHNPAALALLGPELQRFGYRGALDEIAARGEEMGPSLWEQSLYHLWLGALRKLSPDAQRDAALPAVMRTEAWSRRMLNTQLASWAELRHDTLLYAKQSFTAEALCAYPDAYVEPYPEFFRAVEAFAEKGRVATNALYFGNDLEIRRRVAGYFTALARAASWLREIAELERQKQPLRPEHLDFMNHAVSVDGRQAGCTMVLEPGGWYADLYYDRSKVLGHEPTIADVHTQPTDEMGSPVGKVLHVATGAPRFFTVTLDTCEGPRTYRGVVSSYHEVVTEHLQRLDDQEWRTRSAGAPDVAWMKDLVAR